MKHIIIFGAFGLVGRNLCDAIPRFFGGDMEEGIKLTKVKCDEFTVNMESADYITYGSGYGQPQMFGKDKVRTIEINTTSLIKAFSYLKPGGTFLYISSSEVYSGNPLNCSEDEIGNTNPSHPRACYIEGKRAGEAICHSFAEQGYNVKIARLALAYGPGTKAGDTRVLNQFIEQACKTKNITMRDQGEALRTYCYIDDAVDMLWNILLNSRDMVYNIGGFSTLTILELAEEIAKLMNATVTLPEQQTGLSDAPMSVILDMSKYLKEFNKGFVPIVEGLKRTIAYQRKLYAGK